MTDPAASTIEPSRDHEEATLWRSLKTRDGNAARHELFSHYAAFARSIARRHHREQSRGDIELADLTQLAFAGLLEALDRFDPKHGVPFRAFAAHRISGSIRDGIARMSEMREQLSWQRRVRRERVQSLSDPGTSDTSDGMKRVAEIAVGLALGFMLEGTGLLVDADVADGQRTQAAADTAYDSLLWKETVTQLHAELTALPEREQEILRQHYLNGVNFDQLASLLSISKGRVSQLHRSALSLLRKRLGKRGQFHLEK
jgi:RNA polymerase sigma factor FliA